MHREDLLPERCRMQQHGETASGDTVEPFCMSSSSLHLRRKPTLFCNPEHRAGYIHAIPHSSFPRACRVLACCRRDFHLQHAGVLRRESHSRHFSRVASPSTPATSQRLCTPSEVQTPPLSTFLTSTPSARKVCVFVLAATYGKDFSR